MFILRCSTIFLGILFSLLSFSQNQMNPILISLDDLEISKTPLSEIVKLNQETVEFYNHVTKRSELYKGVSFQVFLKHILPKNHAEIVEVEFNSLNGFKSYVPMTMFNQANSILSFERADGEKFVRYSQKEKILISLAPLYLVWDVKSIPREERNIYSSIYQISSINFITNKIDFGVNTDGADQSVLLGLETYKRNCISCHSIGKIGGDISYDLVQKKTVANKGKDFVLKYVMNPSSINTKTKMLGLPKYKNQLQMAQGVVDFLNYLENPDSYLKDKNPNKKSKYQELLEFAAEARKKR